MDLVTRKKYIEEKLKKKAFRIKLLELCKTRAKKSSPDMFKFYVVLAGHDMVTDAGRIPRAGANSKPHHYKQKVQK